MTVRLVTILGFLGGLLFLLAALVLIVGSARETFGGES